MGAGINSLIPSQKQTSESLQHLPSQSSLNLGSFTTSSPVGESKVKKRLLLELRFLFSSYLGWLWSIEHTHVNTSNSVISSILGRPNVKLSLLTSLWARLGSPCENIWWDGPVNGRWDYFMHTLVEAYCS